MNASLLLWLPFDLVYDLGWTLIHFLWQGAALALVLELVLLVTRCARTRYAVAFAALLLMALAPFATFLVVHVSPIQVAPLDALPSIWPALETAFAGSDDAPFVRAILWMNWVVLAWLVGVVAFGVRFAGGWYAGRRLIHYRADPLPAPLLARCVELARMIGVARPVRFLQSAAVQVPAVVGWLRPVLLLPVSVVTGFTPQQLEVLILHELAHIRRLDVVANLIQVAVEMVLFYHPAVWWVSRRIRIERENCCDDLAVSLSGDVLGYARALIALAEKHALPVPAVAASGGVLTQRIARLLGLRVKSGNASAVVVAVIALGVLAGCVAARSAPNTAQAQQAPPAVDKRAEAAADMERLRRQSLEMAQEMYDTLRKQDEIARIPDEAARKKAASELARAGLETSGQRLVENYQRQLERLQRQKEDAARISDESLRERTVANIQQLIGNIQRQQEQIRARNDAMRIPDEAARQQASLALNPTNRQQHIEQLQLQQEQLRLQVEAGRKKSPTDRIAAAQQVQLENMQFEIERAQQMDKIGRQREDARLIQDEQARKKFVTEASAADRKAQLEILQRQIAHWQRQQDEVARIPDAEARKKALAEPAAVTRRIFLESSLRLYEQWRLRDQVESIPDEAARKKAVADFDAANRQQMLEDLKRRLEQAQQNAAMPPPAPPTR